MTLQLIIRTCGVLTLLGALLLLAFWVLYVLLMPYREISGSLVPLATHRHWTWVNLLGISGAVLLIAGVPGIALAQVEEAGRLGVAGMLIALAGGALLLGPLLWDTVLWPVLARHDPALLSFSGPIYRSRLFMPFFVSAGLAWAAGWAILGAASLRAGVFPAPAAWLVAVGAPLFALGSLFGLYQAVPRTIGILLFSGGAAWMGLVLWAHAPRSFGSAGQPLLQRLGAVVGSGDLPSLSIALVERDGSTQLVRLGVADVATGEPVDADSIYLWMSMSKLVTATAVVQLEQQGQLSLDQPAEQWLPGLASLGQDARRVTVRHLLEHRSGLNNPLPLRWVHRPGEPAPGSTAFFERLLREDAKLSGAPGGKARYSNLNYLALGAIIEAVTGRSYTSHVEARLLRPLGMADSGFETAGAARAHEVRGYLARGTPFGLLAGVMLPEGQLGPPVRGLLPLEPYRISGAAYGGLLGTVDDAARFAGMHLGGNELLSAEAVAAMQPSAGASFGLGWQAGPPGTRRYHHHMGGGAGQFAQMRVYPDDGIAVVAMASASGGLGPIHSQVLRAIDLVVEQHLGRPGR